MKKINTALCSFGMSGWVFHAPFIATNPNFCLYAVWERSKNLSKQKYPQVKVFRTLQEMLQDDAIDLVVVNTPSVTHYRYARQALLANKHVIVEKPFTSTTAQAEELISIASQKKLLLSVYQNRIFDSDFKTVKKIINQGLLGNIIDAIISYDRYVPELSYKAHKEAPTEGVGCLYDLGSHLIFQALQLFGKPQSVFADMAINRPHSLVDDYFDIKLFYKSFRVTLKSSYYVREAMPGFQVHGTKGSFIKHKTDVQELDLQNNKIPGGPDWGIEPDSQKGLLHTEKDGVIIKELIISEKGNYGEYYEGIYKALTQNQPPPVTAEEGKEVIEIIEAVLKSYKEKRVIDL
jgi:scyllo-inositol 2-dehydrogenase (NADP+)